ncbi:hypothetical protein ACPVPU_12685 [Sphingomonas sp. CJ99]
MLDLACLSAAMPAPRLAHYLANGIVKPVCLTIAGQEKPIRFVKTVNRQP